MATLDGRDVTPAELQTLALTNYGHFTTMRVEAGRVRGLDLHLARLVRDCRVVFGAELDPDRVRALVKGALPAAALPGAGPSGAGSSGLGEALAVRVTVLDPAIELGTMGAEAHPKLLVTTRPAGPLSGPALTVRSCRFTRDLPEVKGVGLFGMLHQRRLAVRAGYGDALFLDPAGAVCEGSTWNIGFVRGGELVRPEAPALPGTAMALLRGLRPSVTERVAVDGLGGFEAAFATNAVIGVRPIARIDGTGFAADHPVLGELLAAYRDLPGDLL
ncbi:aminotransferase [Kitasatospora sp. MMS16-BH015]|uniref:aminotransferase class IV n=1 Tax=Kitasatospora sp. MMS16-BH015 TaxID=2018025 RepID=UPI000CA0B685|nr:aminotransferase class IV [Kitasatospora sp. MMS16-BH015]AUG76466.1 aminotransferase [Kitasatospora sp. MMS16-BH015]